MNLCSDGHPEIVYDSWSCPMCELNSEHAEEVKELEDRIKNLERDVESLESKLEDQP